MAPLRVAAAVSNAILPTDSVDLNSENVTIYSTIGASGNTTQKAAPDGKNAVRVIVSDENMLPEEIQDAAKIEIARIVFESQKFERKELNAMIKRLGYAGVSSPASLVNLLAHAVEQNLTPAVIARRVSVSPGAVGQYELNIETKVPTVYECIAHSSVQGLVIAAYATEIGNALSIYTPAHAVVDDVFFRASASRGLMVEPTLMNAATATVVTVFLILAVLLYFNRTTHFQAVLADAITEAHVHVHAPPRLSPAPSLVLLHDGR